MSNKKCSLVYLDNLPIWSCKVCWNQKLPYALTALSSFDGLSMTSTLRLRIHVMKERNLVCHPEHESFDKLTSTNQKVTHRLSALSSFDGLSMTCRLRLRFHAIRMQNHFVILSAYSLTNSLVRIKK